MQTKTLKDAIGCWTSADGKWKDLVGVADTVTKTAKRCRQITNANRSPQVLLSELELLKRQIDSAMELTQSAIVRCNEIISTKELEPRGDQQ